MAINKQEQLWSTIRRHGLSPNLAYLLYCIEAKQDINPDNPTVQGWLRKLYETRFIIIEGSCIEVSPLGQEVLDSIDDMCKAPTKNVLGDGYKEKIKKYRELFPSKGIPVMSGEVRHLRDNEHDLETNFKWFFKNFKYSWEDVIKATKLYISDQSQNDYIYCKQSKYLIKKNNESMLATIIEQYKSVPVKNNTPLYTKLV